MPSKESRGKEKPIKPILLPNMDVEQVVDECGDFVVDKILEFKKTGAILGLSGGVDSGATVAIAKKKIDKHNKQNPNTPLELMVLMLPSSLNNRKDLTDAINMAEKLGVRYEIHSIEHIMQAYVCGSFSYNVLNKAKGLLNSGLSLVQKVGLKIPVEYLKSRVQARVNNIPQLTKLLIEDMLKYRAPILSSETQGFNFHRGNLYSEIRASVLHVVAAKEHKVLLGTGNKDEDFGIGYYTLFGDGAVHISPIGGLSKRLVREVACYLGFEGIAKKTPTAGLEPGQTDFKDLGYDYDAVEIVTEGFSQDYSVEQLIEHYQVKPLIEKQIKFYEDTFGHQKFSTVKEVVYDIKKRHEMAKNKAQLVSPEIAKITLRYAA